MGSGRWRRGWRLAGLGVAIGVASLSSPARADAELGGVASATIGGGASLDSGLSVFGGELRAGPALTLGDNYSSFVLIPTLGWSAWRTTDKPASLRAHTFVGRLDLGYMNFDGHYQGFTVFAAGQVGRGRATDPEPLELIRGLQLGATYWPFSGVKYIPGVIGVEFQSRFTYFMGAWDRDLRVVLNVNLVALFGAGAVALCMQWC